MTREKRFRFDTICYHDSFTGKEQQRSLLQPNLASLALFNDFSNENERSGSTAKLLIRQIWSAWPYVSLVNNDNGVFHSTLMTSLHKSHEINFNMQCNKSSSTSLSEHPDDLKSLNDDEDHTRLTSSLNASMPELLEQIPDMRDITEYWIIYPHKIQMILHKDDLLYESNRNNSSALNLGELLVRVD